MNNRYSGIMGENTAEKLLKQCGYKILERNFSCKFGEIDIIAIEPAKVQIKLLEDNYRDGIISKASFESQKAMVEDTLIFVEVKLSSTYEFGEPFERVDSFKQHQIINASQYYLRIKKLDMPCRFDVISIVGDNVEHVINAFICI